MKKLTRVALANRTLEVIKNVAEKLTGKNYTRIRHGSGLWRFYFLTGGKLEKIADYAEILGLLSVFRSKEYRRVISYHGEFSYNEIRRYNKFIKNLARKVLNRLQSIQD